MTDFDIVAAFFAILGFLSVLAGLIVAISLAVTHERDKRRARTDPDTARWQERAARSAAHPRTGQVAAAPRLAPLADVLTFPDHDDRPAA